MTLKGILTTLKTKRELAEIPPTKSGGFISLHQLEDGKLNLSAKEYCLRFGEEADFVKVKKAIEERRAKIPAFEWYRCSKCGWTGKFRGDEEHEGSRCLKCNLVGYKDGGFLKKISEKEVRAYEKTEAEKFAKEVEQRKRARLFEVNQGRQKQGLPVLSYEEFLQKEKEAFRFERERDQRLAKMGKKP